MHLHLSQPLNNDKISSKYAGPLLKLVLVQN